jgi:peptidoglycan DL-endopeptidase CwlO
MSHTYRSRGFPAAARLALAVLLAAALALGGPGIPAAHADPEADRRAAESDARAAQERLDAIRGEIAGAQARLDELEVDLALAVERYHEAGELVAALTATIAEREATIADLEAGIAQRSGEVATVLRSLYQGTSMAGLDTVISAADAAEAQRRLGYLSHAQRAHGEILEGFVAVRRSLDVELEGLASDEVRVAELEAQRAAQAEDIEARLAAQEREVADLRGTVERLEGERRAAEARAAEARREAERRAALEREREEAEAREVAARADRARSAGDAGQADADAAAGDDGGASAGAAAATPEPEGAGSGGSGPGSSAAGASPSNGATSGSGSGGSAGSGSSGGGSAGSGSSGGGSAGSGSSGGGSAGSGSSGGDSASSGSSGSGSAPAPSSAAGRAVEAAKTRLGSPYQWGAAGPDRFDCSGLTSWAWRQAGVEIPRSSGAQYAGLPKVDRASLQPGDLLFFGSPIHHVGMYVGNGQMIEAPYTGEVVRYRSIQRSDFVGAARPGG